MDSYAAQQARKKALEASDALNRRSILFRLPTELLQAIFDLAYADAKPHSLLCHFLSRIVVLARWQNVSIKGYGKLVSFSVVVSRDPPLLSRIRNLSLQDAEFGQLYPLEGDDKAADILSILNPDPLFRKMINLKELELRIN
ncbi:hypothetical protein JCM8547_006085 [Rhodosporidiobolus lusitaniae]